MNRNAAPNQLPPEDRNRLLELASAVCDGSLTDGQSAELEALLDGNTAGQSVFHQYMSLHAELFWIEDTPGNSADLVALAHPGPDVDRTHPFRQRWFSSLALAALLMVGVGFGMFSQILFRTDSPDTVAALSKPLRLHTEKVAEVTGSLNCRWLLRHNEPMIGFGSALYGGQHLELVEGVAEITFGSGARVILQAPVAIDLDSAIGSSLKQGRLTATCPAGAEGFQINTPGLTLIDRGTEFGVLADSQGNTEVHVFDGLVEGLYRDSSSAALTKVQWKTDETVFFDHETKQLSELEGPSANFVRTIAPNLGPVNGLLAGEEFDYPIGSLGGQNGGFGWGGPWEDMSVDSYRPKSNCVDAGSLRYGVLSTSGNRAALTGHFNRIRRRLSTSFSGVFDTANLIEDQDGARLIGRNDTTVYISFTQQVTHIDQVFYGFELNRGDGNRNRVLCLGHAAARGWTEENKPDTAAGVTGWAVTSETNGTDGLIELGELGNETTEVVLFVVKISFGAGNNDTVEVFMNPASLWDEDQCTPQVTGKGNFAFDRIGLANFEGNKTYLLDQIRIGSSFASVTRPLWQHEPVADNFQRP